MLQRTILTAQILKRFAFLFRQGLSELKQKPAVGQPVTDYYIVFGNGRPGLRRNGKPGEVDVTPDMLAQLAEKTGHAPLDLIFCDKSCIDLRFKVPLGTQDQMRAHVEREIVYRSPFSEDAAICFWVAEEKPDHSWHARAAVALRKNVDEVLSQLQTAGLPIGVVRRELKNARFAARPEWARQQMLAPAKRSWLSRLPLSLVAAVLFGVLLCLSGFVAFSLRGGHVDALQAQLAQAEGEAQQQAETRSRILANAASQTSEKRALLATLEKAFGTEVSLDQIEIDAGAVSLTGTGPSAADVTRVLSALPQLSDIRFLSPVTRDTDAGVERFEIAVSITQAPE